MIKGTGMSRSFFLANSPSSRRGGSRADGVVDRGRETDTANSPLERGGNAVDSVLYSPSRRRGGRGVDRVVDFLEVKFPSNSIIRE